LAFPAAVALLILLSSCAGERGGENTEPEPKPGPELPSMSGMAHGDHSPKYGGIVWMKGDLHFEVVLDRGGSHRIYFSDAFRAELPASVVADVKLAIHRPGEDPETIDLTIDEYGESWLAAGRPVEDPEANVVVSFVHEGAPYELEYVFGAGQADVPDPHANVPPPNP
jgi:hypothetical protein